MESESIVNTIIMVVDSIDSRMDNRQRLEWNVYIDGNDNGFPIIHMFTDSIRRTFSNINDDNNSSINSIVNLYCINCSFEVTLCSVNKINFG